MKPFISFYLRYILFFLAVQMIFRIITLITYHDLIQGAGFWNLSLTLVYGLKLDVSLTGYILGVPTVALIFLSIFN